MSDFSSGDGQPPSGDGAISLPVLSAELVAAVADGPKRTTSLYGRRTPLAHPELFNLAPFQRRRNAATRCFDFR